MQLAVPAEVSLRLDPTGKAARGYRLASGQLATPRKAEPLHLNSAMSPQKAFSIIARGCLEHIVANIDCAYEGHDPEGVHQVRVGVRRLRAAASAFRKVLPKSRYVRLGRDLHWLQRELGSAREWDVFIESGSASSNRTTDPKGLAALAEKERARAHERCRAALGSRRCANLLLDLASLAIAADAGRLVSDRTTGEPAVSDLPIVGFAAATLRKRHRQVRRLGKTLDSLDAAELHKLRIRVKRLRYATEFFADLWPRRRTAAYVAALKALQDLTGRLEDGFVAGELLGKLEAKAQPHQGESIKLQRVTAARLKRLRRKLTGPWKKFDASKPFWKGDARNRIDLDQR
jgi:triphosphatase